MKLRCMNCGKGLCFAFGVPSDKYPKFVYCNECGYDATKYTVLEENKK